MPVWGGTHMHAGTRPARTARDPCLTTSPSPHPPPTLQLTVIAHHHVTHPPTIHLLMNLCPPLSCVCSPHMAATMWCSVWPQPSRSGMHPWLPWPWGKAAWCRGLRPSSLARQACMPPSPATNLTAQPSMCARATGMRSTRRALTWAPPSWCCPTTRMHPDLYLASHLPLMWVVGLQPCMSQLHLPMRACACLQFMRVAVFPDPMGCHWHCDACAVTHSIVVVCTSAP